MAQFDTRLRLGFSEVADSYKIKRDPTRNVGLRRARPVFVYSTPNLNHHTGEISRLHNNPANMPGRPSVRASRAAATARSTRKASAATTKSRVSSTRSSTTQAVEIPDEGESTSLRERVCTIFAD